MITMFQIHGKKRPLSPSRHFDLKSAGVTQQHRASRQRAAKRDSASLIVLLFTPVLFGRHVKMPVCVVLIVVLRRHCCS